MAKSSAWKNLEKKVATELNGIRIHRGGNFSESLPDVIAPTEQIFGIEGYTHAIVAECKYRQKQPWIKEYKKITKQRDPQYQVNYIEVPVTNIVTGMPDSIVLVSLEEFKDYFKYYKLINPIILKAKKIPGYLHEYCAQSRSYINDIEIRLSVQYLYYKHSKDITRPKFTSYSSIAVIGQKHDDVRLVIFYKSEFSKIINATSSR